VVIADDHPPTRAGVHAALEDGGFDVCAEASTAPDAVAAVAEHRPDIALLDVQMPGNGIAAAAEISRRFPETAVVMLTVSRSNEDLFDSLRAGAVGYLLKDTDPNRLPHALRGVLAGEAALPRTLVTRLVDEFRERSRKRRVPIIGSRQVELTSREWEVLQLLRDGLRTEEIAGRLFVSPVTVRTHVSSILKKLQVRDRKAAVRLFEENG
jgi:DNA-binding NarL/FixJ family response regulator